MIQPTSNSLGYTRAEALATAAAKATPALKTNTSDGERLSSGQTDNLRSALSQVPEIRPDVVERGRQLALDVHWPPLDIIQGLAKLMVNSTDLSEQH